MISLFVMMLHQYITKDKTITQWAVCFLGNKGQEGHQKGWWGQWGMIGRLQWQTLGRMMRSNLKDDIC
jgi:hypothetical protein